MFRPFNLIPQLISFIFFQSLSQTHGKMTQKMKKAVGGSRVVLGQSGFGSDKAYGENISTSSQSVVPILAISSSQILVSSSIS